MTDMARTEKILAWVEDNAKVTINQIPKSIIIEMLHIAETDEANFAAVMARGLAYHLHSSGGNSSQFGSLVAAHIANCKLRLRLALAAPGEVPPLQLFSLEGIKSAHMRAVRMRNLEARRLAASG